MKKDLNIYNEVLLNRYSDFLKKRNIFEEKIDLHSYYQIFYKWLYLYGNDDLYKQKLINSLDNNIKYSIKIDVDTCKKIARDFYYDLSEKFGNKFDSIINNEKNVIMNIDKNMFGNVIENSFFSSVSDNLVDSKIYGILEIKNYNSIETLYSIIHEVMHAINTVDNMYTQSIFAVREVAAYFSESILSDYLVKNSDKYGFDKEELLHDVYYWKLMRYFNCFNIKKRTYSTQHFLGLLLTAPYDRLSYFKKKQQLNELIYYLNNDRLDIALKSIDFKVGQEKHKESGIYLKSLVNNFIMILNNLQKNDNLITQKKYN